MSVSTLVQQERPLSALDAIFTRRSVRTYTSQRLDKPTIRALLDAAVQAPTAMHVEPWKFVVVQEAAALKRISERAKGIWLDRMKHAPQRDHDARFVTMLSDPHFSIFYDATTLIVIGATVSGPYIAGDCWLAAENLMLASCAMGLGTCCIGFAVPAMNAPETKADLGLAPDFEAIAAVIVGVPSGEVAAVTRKDPHVVCWR